MPCCSSGACTLVATAALQSTCCLDSQQLGQGCCWSAVRICETSCLSRPMCSASSAWLFSRQLARADSCAPWMAAQPDGCAFPCASQHVKAHAVCVCSSRCLVSPVGSAHLGILLPQLAMCYVLSAQLSSWQLAHADSCPDSMAAQPDGRAFRRASQHGRVVQSEARREHRRRQPAWQLPDHGRREVVCHQVDPCRALRPVVCCAESQVVRAHKLCGRPGLGWPPCCVARCWACSQSAVWRCCCDSRQGGRQQLRHPK